MSTWSADRFPKTWISSTKVKIIKSSSSARTAFLNRDHLEPIRFAEVEITKISDDPVALFKPPELDEADLYSQSFGSVFHNIFESDFLRLAESQSTPILAGPRLKIDKETGLPLWTVELLQIFHKWNTVNPDLKFTLGKDPDGHYRIVMPMVKIHSPFEKGELSLAHFRQLDEALERIDKRTSFDKDLRIGAQKPRTILGRLLTYRYLWGDFGAIGTRIINYGTEPIAGMEDSKNTPLNQEGSVFRFTNLVRAHALTQASPEIINLFFKMLSDKAKFENWFEVAYWISKPEVLMRTPRLRWAPKIELSFKIQTDRDAIVAVKGWSNPKSLRKHFKKHGKKEMGFLSEEDYLAAATEFFEDRSESQILITRSHLITKTKYIFQTQEFGVIDEGGNIITYYRLTEDYRSAEEFHQYIGEDALTK